MTVGHGSPQVANRCQVSRLNNRDLLLCRCAQKFRSLPGRFSFLAFLATVFISSHAEFLFAQAGAGQISPNTSNVPATEFSVGPVGPIVGSQSAVDRLEFELRVVWGGGGSRAFSGAITIDDGSLKVVRNLSLQADSIGAISNVSAAKLSVAAHSPSTFGGADLRITGSPASRVTIRFDHPSSGKPIEQSFALSEVLQEQWSRPIDEQGSRVAAERQMQDRLRVIAASESSVFQVGTNWRGTVGGYRTGLQAGEYQLSAKLLDLADGDKAIAEEEYSVTVDANGNFRSPSIEMTLPTVESAYSLAFSLNRKRFLPSFVSSSQSLQRRVDLVTFDYQAQPKRIEYWAAVAAIQPLNNQWWSPMNWFSTLSQSQPLKHLPAFSETPKRLVSHGKQGTRRVGEVECLTLGPDAWQAYPLAIEHPDRPHRLRVRIPRDRTQQLLVSIRDYHDSGEPSSLNIDTGVVVSERQVTTTAVGEGLWANHEVVFWPRSSQPYLLMMNGAEDSDASFGELQLEVAEVVPFEANVTSQPLAATTLATNALGTPAQPSLNDSRTVALYLTKPLLADAFGARRSIDPVTRRPLESWLTWHQVATRMTQFMMNAGYNTLVLSAVTDGGSVTPFPRLQTTSRFDSGAFFTDGRSPETKDFVELLSCHFDRCGLKLILALDVRSQLLELARFEDHQPTRAGLFQTNLEGKEWSLPTQESNRCVLYNPLNEHVQAELEQIVRELSQRYAQHACFRGLAIELSERSHFAFAGDRWGFDPATLARYESATQSKLPAPDALATAMQGGLRLSFLNWRARELSAFYVRMANTIRQAKADARLLINPLGMWTHPPTQHEYTDAVAASRSLSDTLLAAGVDLAWLKQQPNISVLRGQMDSPLDNETERAWQSRVNHDPSLLFANAGNFGGSLNLQLPVAVPVPDAIKLAAGFENRSAANGYPNVTALGSFARKAFIERLYYEDSLMLADGAWMPVQQDSDQVVQFRKSLLELPNVPMRNVRVDGEDTNFRMRTAKVGNNTFLQVINNASWTERVTMDVKIAEIPGVYEVLGGRELEIDGAVTAASSSSRVDASGIRASAIWQFDLPPYDMVAIKISDPQFKLNSLIHSSDSSVVEGLKNEIDAFESQLAKIGDGARGESLGVPGGDFEVWVDGARPQGWMTSSLPLTTIGPETALPRSGAKCVVIENKNQAKVSAWLQSEQIRIPTSGRVVVSAWVRSPSVSNQSQQMRLSLIGRMRDGRRYQRSHQFMSNPTTVTNAKNVGEVAVDWGRRPVTMYVTDLPSAELTELYVAFDLIGPGKVWLDNVQAFEAYLDPDERVLIHGQLFVAKEKLRQSNAFAAEQLLNSYLARYVQSVITPTAKQALNPAKQIAAPERMVDRPVDKASTSERWNNPTPVLKQLRESMRERWQR